MLTKTTLQFRFILINNRLYAYLKWRSC